MNSRDEQELSDKISQVAQELHEEWESPFLWTRIRSELQAKPARATFWWAPPALASAALVLLAAALLVLGLNWYPHSRPNGDLLTADALREVEQTEKAYVRSIEKLAALGAASLEASSSPLAAVYREKLLLLDSAIADIKANVETNRYNVYLRNELASLYRDKQAMLEEWLKNEKKN